MIDVALAKLLEQRAGIGQRIGTGSNNVNVTKDLPRVFYTLIDDPPQYCDEGPIGLRKARYQLDAFARDMDEARSVLLRITRRADATTSPGLDGFKGTVTGAEGTDIKRIYFGGHRHGQAATTPGQNQAVARCTVDVMIDYRELN